MENEERIQNVMEDECLTDEAIAELTNGRGEVTDEQQ